MIKHLGLKAYGKINLALDVLRKKEDGYHEVRMIMQTVRVYDKIDLIRSEQPGIRLSTNLYYLPDNENNLGYKKFIPVAAGMAGGSSDAAAVLFGVNKMFSLGLSMEQLMERGVKLGADVPYCVIRGTAFSEGIGEILTPLPPVPQCQVLIARPPISVSTKWVYENLNVAARREDEHPDVDRVRRAIGEADLYGIAGHMGNILETVTIPAHPVIRELKEEMKRLGAINALMSGSGPTVFGLFANPAAAERAYEELRFGNTGLARQVYLTSFYNRRA